MNYIEIMGVATVTAALTVGVYCIWNGRKILIDWKEQKIVKKVQQSTKIAWDQDENNPANWYLKSK